MTLSFLTEHHMRVVRALLGLTLGERSSAAEVARAIRYGPFQDDAYQMLASVVASLFASMAVHERGPNGRARREVLEDVDMATYASNGLRVPRYLVALLASACLSIRASQRLARLERARVAVGTYACMGLARGGTSGAQAMLVHCDKFGVSWMPVEQLKTFEAGATAVAKFDAMLLGDFGAPPIDLPPDGMPLPFEFDNVQDCPVCRTTRSCWLFGLNPVCKLCTDAGVAQQAKHREPGLTRARVAPKVVLPSELACKHTLPAPTSDAADAALLANLRERLEHGKRGKKKEDPQHYLRALALARGAMKAAMAGIPKGGAQARIRETRNAMVTIYLVEGSDVFPSAAPPLDDAGRAALEAIIADHAAAKVAAATAKRAAADAADGDGAPRRQRLRRGASTVAPAASSEPAPAATAALPIVPAHFVAVAPPGVPVAIAECTDAPAEVASAGGETGMHVDPPGPSRGGESLAISCLCPCRTMPPVPRSRCWLALGLPCLGLPWLTHWLTH